MADTGATTTVPGARSRSRRPSLASKLVWLGTLLTAVVVTLTFAVLSVSVERHTRGLLAETLAQHQTTLQSLERAGLDELLRTSTLMTDSPTLRAAMETFAEEAGSAPSLRPDLLETIQAEADKIAAGLGRDLLVVTDRSGRVLAASGAVDLEPRVGSEFAVHEITRNVLAQRGPVGPRNFAVLRLGESRVRVGCVPILLQGFVIGTLTLGERIDAAFVDRLERSFGCDVAVLAGSEVVTSTLDDPAVAAALRTASATGHESSGLVTLDGQEYVSARGLLGRAGRSEPVELVLLGALSPRLADANRELLLIVVGCGLLALVLSGSAAWWMSRSVLRPLERFVAFMRDVASSGDHARRFDAGGAGVEIETLHEAYGSLMDSLLEHERRLLETSRRELDRLERLKESEKLAALGRMLSGPPTRSTTR